MPASSPTDISGIDESKIIVSSGSRLRYHGFCAEASGGDVRFRLRSGSLSGVPLLCVHLLDGQTVSDTDPDGQIVPDRTGIFFEHVDGGQFLIGSIKTNPQGD